MTMKMFRKLAAGAVCAAQAACASSPESISAHYVSPNVYQNWSCQQIVEERTRLTKEVERVSGLQRENANTDTALMTVGIIIFWPALFGLAATKDRKDELGRLKGEYEAVDLAARSRQCTAPEPGVAPSVPAVPAPPPAATLSAVDGQYRGKGRTDSWCQPPTLSLSLHGNRLEGALSEIASGGATSTVTGTLDPAGVASLDFQGSSADYFSGKADGTLRDGVLSIAFQSKTARACHYAFDLRRTAAVPPE